MSAALIAWLAAASEGGRDLDLSIAKAINDCPQDAWLESGNDEVHWHEVRPFGSTVAYEPLSDRLAHYTTSVDTALTLVPSGWSWQVSDRAPKPNAGRAYLTNREPHTVGMSAASNPAFRYSEETAATPALALCIAALRARQTEGPQA